VQPSDILVPRPEGLWCEPAGCFIDPVRPVERALITHGHADHARAGHGRVLATAETLAIMAVRYGRNFAGSTQVAEPGEVLRLGGAAVTFVPAGHVLGSAQILVEHAGLRIVVSGDYKRASDPTCQPFEPIRCHVFVSEATFGLPVFRHPPASAEVARLLASRQLFPDRAHLVGAYALGKAQRIMALLRQAGYDRPIYLHGAMEKLTSHYLAHGIDLGEVRPVKAGDRAKLAGEIILCPPGSLADLWSRRFPDPVSCFASGWMQTRARARQRGVELPLVISDHADWSDLCRTILETGCSELWVTHGQEDALVHWAGTRGLAARPLRLVGYGEEDDADGAPAAPTVTEHATTAPAPGDMP
jgi:putative mRNA 3-end processing factor